MLATLILVALSPMQASWPLEELTLTNGAKLPGLVLAETAEGIRFRVVRRPIGRPTITLTCFFPTAEVKAVRHLSEAERKTLQEKLAELDATTTGERKRAEDLTLKPNALSKLSDAMCYESERFKLIATTKDEITRRAAVRLEQIFIAYERYLPPRTQSPQPTTIYLLKNQEDYLTASQQVLKTRGTLPNFPPLAFFDPGSNAVVCGSELRQLGADLAAARHHHLEQLAEVTQYEKRIADLYRTAPRTERERHLALAAEERKKVLIADRRNDGKFDEATAQFFGRLYHEAFHAYVGNYVHRELSLAGVKAGEGTGPLPRWLNEGLAQIFETPILDGYELRVGHADQKRLDAVQAGLKTLQGGVALMPLNDLLVGGFVEVHRPRATDATMAYHTSWAVAMHLTFERRLVGTQALDTYLIAINSGTSPRLAFETLVGKDIAAYEAELRDYLRRLRPDGTLRK